MSLEKIDSSASIVAIKTYFQALQHSLCTELEKEDGKAYFIKDPWDYQGGGGGLTCILSEGAVFEKAGVNFSHVHGKSLPQAATANRVELANCSFQALGVSLVAHPLNPYAPTAHMNVRFVLVEKPDGNTQWWFGGGFDLTPYYGFIEDCEHWHRTAQQACDPFGADVYSTFKKWCDDYFYLKHRKEARGIGGLFFDDLHQWGFERSFNFIRSVGDHFIKAYQPIVSRRKKIIFGEREKNFQLYRRGRYVEFNLLYDRGTLFGIQSGGRTESILMSLPPEVSWKYHWQPIKGSEEMKLYEEFLIAREWISL